MKKPELCELGMAIQHFEREAGVSSYRLAQLTSITEATISNIKLGKSGAKLDTIERIAKGLGVKASDILIKYEEYLCQFNQ